MTRKKSRYICNLPRSLFSILSFFAILWIIISCNHKKKQITQSGLDNIHQHLNLLQKKRIALVTNQSAINLQEEHILSIFSALPDVDLKKVFTPEHGLKGEIIDGQKRKSFLLKENIKVVDLYGSHKIPKKKDLANIDLLVFDIQSVGVRYYTYISTLKNIITAAARYGKEVLVLDRPNPIGGKIIEGPILKKQFRSFKGLLPLPIRYGMTIGELARMIKGERWHHSHKNVRLNIIPLSSWTRDKFFQDTGRIFIKTSPNIPDAETALIYSGFGLLEGTNLNEGRGTHKPFKVFGAPWLKSKKLLKQLEQEKLQGIHFKPVEYIPKAIPGMELKPKYQNMPCRGIAIEIIDKKKFLSYRSAVTVIYYSYHLHRRNFRFRREWFAEMVGTDKVYQEIVAGKKLEEILSIGNAELAEFRKKRKKYLLYP